MSCIAITGGLGYIGSHIIAALSNSGQEILVIDNLSNSKYEKLTQLKAINKQTIYFEQCDISSKKDLNKILQKYSPQGVIHLAASKYVSESVCNPLLYYNNNVVSLITLLECMVECQIPKLVFSSTAALYGSLQSKSLERGFVETDSVLPSSPYARSKRVCEEILQEVSKVSDQIDVCILRYFNPAGAHQSLLIGEDITEMSTNVFPQLCKAVHKGLPFYLNGLNYKTSDGSAERDFIHIDDLAEFHICAFFDCPNGFSIFNVGTGVSTSILNLLDTFERVNNVELKRVVTSPRPGDVACSYANVSKAKLQFGFRPQRRLEEMCSSAWNYYVSGGY